MKRLVLASLAALLCAAATVSSAQVDVETDEDAPVPFARTLPQQQPIELHLQRGRSSNVDLRNLPQTPPKQREKPEREVEPHPVELPGRRADGLPTGPTPVATAPAPPPIASFDGLDRAGFGQGHPPDTNGDVGPTYYIQAINSSVGVFRKSDGVRVAAFSFDTLMSQGSFGNLCDTDNFGDPVVLYDTFEDRWILTDFAFTLDGSGNVINPPGAFQCFAVSKTGDPVSGGWNFYSINTTGGLGDYPKFGVWTDGIYMSANMFGYAAGASFQGPRVYAFNKKQMYAGAPTVQVVTFEAPVGDFTLLPGNARLQTGTPPAGTPAYFVSSWQFLNSLTVYKFHVDWTSIGNSTFTGPDQPLAATSWPNASVANAPSLGGNSLDVLQIRAMMQNQYTNIGGVESLWTTHTVRRANTTGFAAPRWYQVNVTGGTVAANLPQAATWDPDGANVMHRFMPSLAVDRAGNLALGYSTSSSSTKPAIKYAGRLATDPVNTFSQTEQVLIQGTGTQTGSCGGTCARWGDYSAMTLDPDGCTFWYTNEYYAVDGLNYLTRIGSFAYPSCTAVGAGGTVSGTVTAQSGGAPLSGAVVTLGSRSTTTDGSGHYSFTAIPAGTYPDMSASFPGCTTGTASNIAVIDSATTTQDFALAAAPASACLTDTTQADFQAGVATNIDLATSVGDATLTNPDTVDQQNASLGTSGVGITTTTWGGQTFTPATSGNLKKIDVNLFCSGCTGTTPNLTLSIRATAGGLPTGADLATATVTGFNSGASAYYTATFSPAFAVTAGTQYALAIRPTANPSPGTYALTRSGTSTTGADVYAGGTRVAGATSGTVWSIPLTGGVSTDAGFRIYINSGYSASGDLVSAAKDANPAAGYVPTWTTLSWNGTTPANTSLRFQVAASNSASGPFNFVGPDGTAGTFFTTSGASLSQFNGNRYLKYRAYLATTNTAVTPTLNDATVCFVDLAPPDLSLTMSDGGASVAPGGTVSYTLGYANGGGQAATGVVLTETVPANGTFNAGASTAGWSCTPNNNAGSTCTLAIGSVAGAGSGNASFAVTVGNPVAAGVTQLSNTASIADDGTHGVDATPGNNSASDTTPVNAAPDLTLTKSDGGVSVAPGGSVTYTLGYANAGNQGATGVTLTDVVPANTSFNPGASTAGWVCTPNNNAGSTCTLAIGGLAGGTNGNASYAVTVGSPLSPSVTQISNQASITDDGSNGSDPTPSNNMASDTTPISGADLAITKSDGVTSAPTGGTVVYTITASNAGPNGVSGATVADTFPASLTCTWTCSSAGGGTCAGSGSGSINDGSVNLPVSASVTYTANCSIAINASGSLSNTATVATPAGVTDPTPGNNSATDTDTLFTAADVSVTVNDGRNYVQVGDSLNYTIEVSNAGPSTALASVSDTLPALLSGGSWVCSGTTGVTCANGTGNTLSDNATVPSGGKATYVYSATVASAGSDLLDNTASASLTTGTDPVPANNSATDHDVVVFFRNGFEGAQLIVAGAGTLGGSDFVTAQLRIDAGLSGSLSIVPVEVAHGRGADGKLLFTLELARFGNDIAVRSITRDAQGLSQRSAWQAIDTSQRMLRFAWQSASGGEANGYLNIEGGLAPLVVGGRSEESKLTHLLVTVQQQVPWLVLITH
ncbi:beta strand repeat-containing protein [Tahibacter caeni]|uniref:beta strand repeat-containing protein n=1 Tax=Tahibacter caeni TaxID=1453545 RepID=UPI0021472365|nr:carboxypeptidase regulatory-like domain-containing protein [Tahibacter caeni]